MSKFKSFFIVLMLLAVMPVQANIAVPAGKIIFSLGKVTIESGEGEIRRAKRGGSVYEGDVVRTNRRGQAQIKFIDDGRVSIRADSEFKIDAYHYSLKNKKYHKSEFSLLKGGIRSITGAIGKSNKKSYKLKTVIATIGIRGTDYSLMLCNGDCGGEVKDGLYVGVSSGGVTLENDSGSIDLDPNQYAMVGGIDSMPKKLQIAPSFLMFDRASAKKSNKIATKNTSISGNDKKEELKKNPESKAASSTVEEKNLKLARVAGVETNMSEDAQESDRETVAVEANVNEKDIEAGNKKIVLVEGGSNESILGTLQTNSAESNIQSSLEGGIPSAVVTTRYEELVNNSSNDISSDFLNNTQISINESDVEEQNVLPDINVTAVLEAEKITIAKIELARVEVEKMAVAEVARLESEKQAAVEAAKIEAEKLAEEEVVRIASTKIVEENDRDSENKVAKKEAEPKETLVKKESELEDKVAKKDRELEDKVAKKERELEDKVAKKERESDENLAKKDREPEDKVAKKERESEDKIAKKDRESEDKVAKKDSESDEKLAKKERESEDKVAKKDRESEDKVAKKDRESDEKLAKKERESEDKVAKKERESEDKVAKKDRESDEKLAKKERESEDKVAKKDRDSEEKVTKKYLDFKESIATVDERPGVVEFFSEKFVQAYNAVNQLFLYVVGTENTDESDITGQVGIYNTAQTDEIVYESGLIKINDEGSDSQTGLEWGRWSIERIAMSDGERVESLDFISNVHWVVGPSSDTIELPITGVRNYVLVGGTNPTDNLGNVGALGSASLTANFDTQLVSADVSLDINNRVWEGTQADISLNMDTGEFSTDQLQVNVNGGVNSSGALSGGLTDSKVGGAGLVYQLGASINGQQNQVTGAVAFREAP